MKQTIHTTKWALFLDDERVPTSAFYDKHGFVIVCTTVDAAMNCIKILGIPAFMSLDHDLGPNEQTGYEFLKQFVNYLLDNELKWDYDYYVHSQNPVGKSNMEGLIKSYRKHLSALDDAPDKN